MPTDLEPGWPQRKRTKYDDRIENSEHMPMPGVTWLSDYLKKIDMKRQTGYNEEDLPPEFKVDRSFIKVPHHLLGKDGYPVGEGWLHPSCQEYLQNGKGKVQADQEEISNSKLQPTTSLLSSSQVEVGGKQNTFAEFIASVIPTSPLKAIHKDHSSENHVGKIILQPTTSSSSAMHPGVETKAEPTEPPFQTMSKRVAATLPSLYDLDHGLESVKVPVPGKVRRGMVTRHPRKAIQGTAQRRQDLSSAGEKAKGSSFKRAFRRFDDPVLPVEDYVRTMEIVSKIYHVIDHGDGQLVDRKSQKLICTFSFEDLETMEESQQQLHQGDVDTIMKATNLFRRMPIAKQSPTSTTVPAPSKAPTRMSTRSSVRPTTVATSKPTSTRAVPVASITHSKSTTRTSTVRRTMIDPSNSTSLTEESKRPDNLHLSPTSKMKMLQYKECIPVLDQTIPPSVAQTDLSSPLTSLAPSDTDETKTHNQIIHLPSKQLDQRLRDLLLDQPLQTSATRESSPLTSLEPSEVEEEESPPGGIEKNITTNGALLNGKMFCFGARAGYDPEVLFSPYIPCQGASLSLYKLFLSELPIFGEHMGTRFKAFADEAFLTARKMLRTLNAPSMTATDKDEETGAYDFAGNFAFTFHNFFNKPHTNNDKGKVYCVWYPIDSINGRIVTLAEGFILEGGYFLFPEYRIAFKFGAKDVVQICWSGKSTFHQTLQSKEVEVEREDGSKTHFTRLGCSTQITSSLARAAAKLGTEEQYNFTSNCEREVLDCNDILASDGRKWKP